MKQSLLGKESPVTYSLNLMYLLLVLLAMPWLLYAAIRKGKYREGYAEKLLGLVPRRESGQTCVWLHAVSVGEVNLLEPLIRSIREQRPEWEYVVSTTTMTGPVVRRVLAPTTTIPVASATRVKSSARALACAAV